MGTPRRSDVPSRPPVGEDAPLSPHSAEWLRLGLESARRGEIQPWDDFTKYVTDESDDEK